MTGFLLRRLGLMILTLWILSLIVFFAGQILPGDPGRATLGQFAAPSAVQALDHQLGVDRPLLTSLLQRTTQVGRANGLVRDDEEMRPEGHALPPKSGSPVLGLNVPLPRGRGNRRRAVRR